MKGLSLTRKENESIVIDDSLRVIVTRLSRTQVRLRFETIEGKPQLSVMREELYNTTGE